MMLCLDVGNSHIYGGVFNQKELSFSFRYPSKGVGTSDQFGIFLKNVLRENEIDSNAIRDVAICSVVPSLDYSIRAACIKYFDVNPFLLQAGVKTGLQIKSKNPLEVGSDRIANAIAATNQFPDRNLIVVDLGTATTFCAITSKKEYLGGVIMPGVRISMEALHTNAAKLFPVTIVKPENIVGRTTVQNIQSGLYYGHLGALREIKHAVMRESFTDQDPLVIGTGGFAQLFEQEKIFTAIIPELVLHGLRIARKLNR
jgi:type III pantothenate kinase